MKEPFLYIIESIVCSGLFLSIYRLCIVRHTAFRVSRLFLLFAMMGACAIPLLQIPVWSSDTKVVTLPLLWDTYADASGVESLTISSTKNWLTGIYFVGVVVMLIRMSLPLFRAMKLERKSQVMVHGAYSLVVSKDVQHAFSSLRTVYLPLMENKEEENMVMMHEESHLRHFHIAERWLMELLKAFCWFNPFVWIASRYLVEIQEMEADADVLHQGIDLTAYRQMLLKHTIALDEGWVCNFSPSFMKVRMLAMTEQRKVQNYRMWLMIPMLAFGLVCFGFTIKPVQLSNGIVTGNEVVINGRILDEQTGEPIYGAIVIEVESTNGTLTNKKGEFRLKTKKEKTLKFVMSDYNTLKIEVNELGEQNLDIKLNKAKE
ncbi:MAG: carboxypeptidase-like regulatory domain-containing protein [Bacteroidaceae bacterium]|nr:carboxypeptidase-like regulatory domain-containing protein [Bacteroidaceae bacterium]